MQCHKPPRTPPTVWRNCYDDSWRDLISPESFSHPAKMARGLVRRIFDYLIETGRLRPGDVCVDPFGGIGTTAIEGASRGMRVVCCELEERFVSLCKANFELHRRTWEVCGDPLPIVLQGDSRFLRRVIAEAGCIVSSPPYAETEAGKPPRTGEHRVDMKRDAPSVSGAPG